MIPGRNWQFVFAASIVFSLKRSAFHGRKLAFWHTQSMYFHAGWGRYEDSWRCRTVFACTLAHDYKILRLKKTFRTPESPSFAPADRRFGPAARAIQGLGLTALCLTLCLSANRNRLSSYNQGFPSHDQTTKIGRRKLGLIGFAMLVVIVLVIAWMMRLFASYYPYYNPSRSMPPLGFSSDAVPFCRLCCFR